MRVMGPYKVIFLLFLYIVNFSLAAENSTVTPLKVSKTNSSANDNSIAQPPPETSSEVDLTTTDIPCSKDSPCSISEGLVCQNGTCKCAYSNLTYDPGAKKCLAKLGEQCGFFIGLKNASTVACPENAICALINLQMVTDGQNNQYSAHQCACIYTHYKNQYGNCVPLGKHGESCDSIKKCNVESEIVCRNGTCQCQFLDDQFYDPQLDKCVSYAGGNCTRSCAPHSICDFWNSGTCQCRVDHRINAERFCEPIPPGYLSPCFGENELCNSEIGLKCIDKVCQCSNPLHQIYDFQLDKCIGLAGDMCNPSLPDNCVKDSKCVKISEKVERHVCKCIDGFSTTPFRKCMKSFQENCSNEFCNVYRGLACINGSCQCYDSFLKYNDTLNACLSGVGSPCGKVFVPFPGEWIKNSCPECDSYYFACDASSTCARDFSQGAEVGSLEKFRCQTKPKQ